MSNAQSIDTGQRIDNYIEQNMRNHKAKRWLLTPKQRRRANKKLHQDMRRMRQMRDDLNDVFDDEEGIAANA